MSFEVIGIEDGGNGPEDDHEVTISISRDGFRGFATDMANSLSEKGVIDDWEVIRETERNPAIKTENGTVYLHYNGGGSRISLALAEPELAEAVERWLIKKSEGEVGGTEKGPHKRMTGGEVDEKAKDRRDERGFREKKERAEEYADSGGDGEAGVGEVYKPFGHSTASYMDEGDQGFNPSHERCRDCAHWDDQGNCHIVPDVEPDGYCEEFYADVGVFGHEHGGYVEENLILQGEMFDWSVESIKEFSSDVRERLESLVR